MVHSTKRRKVSEGKVVAIGTEGDQTHKEDQKNDDASTKATAEQLKYRRQLFIRSLAPETTSEDLIDLFSQSYPIKHAVAVTDGSTQQCKGYGFVTFADPEDAQNAKEGLQNAMLHGRSIKLDIAEPRNRERDGGEGADPNAQNAAKPNKPGARPHGDQEQNARPNTLILRNLPWSIKNVDQLTGLFKSYGKVKRANLPTKGPSKTLRGFGIVVMRNHDQASKAMESLNGKEIDGRTIAVDWSVDKDIYTKMQQVSQPDNDESEAVIEDGEGHIVDEEEMASDRGAEDEDESDDELDEDEEEGEGDDLEPDATAARPKFSTDNSSTLFIRNLPFQASDESLKEHFTGFGPVRYARIVMDLETGLPKGTGFVCFFNKDDSEACVKGAPKSSPSMNPQTLKSAAGKQAAVFSVLQNLDADPTGQYTMDGRVLQVSQAVNKDEAERLRAEGVEHRFARDKDKRRLYLLHEGTVATNSSLYKKLSPAEITLRDASIKQRKTLLEKNPSLHLSLTRLSIRNIPRSISSKDLKALARSAVVGFATDVKNGLRQPLAKEELARGSDDMKSAEKDRKEKGKGVVKQAKIVFENEKGGKVKEESGAGRSRGYGFVEYYSHRNALMGLRWLNGHEVGYVPAGPAGKSSKKEEAPEKKKRLIVEFAIENSQVVQRRKERQVKEKGGRLRMNGTKDDEAEDSDYDVFGHSSDNRAGMKRKRGDDTQRRYRSQDRPHRSQDRPPRFLDRPHRSQDRPYRSEDRPQRSHNKPFRSQGRPDNISPRSPNTGTSKKPGSTDNRRPFMRRDKNRT